MLLLVRHADAGNKCDWAGPDLRQPLSPVGGRQAAGLVERLWDYPVEQILSSPALRCHQTMQPLARDRYLRIESAPALGVGADPELVLTLFWDPGLRDTVLCSHGETITRLLAHLASSRLVTDAPLEAAKGSTWLLDRSNGRVYGRYLPPLALERPQRVSLPQT